MTIAPSMFAVYADSIGLLRHAVHAHSAANCAIKPSAMYGVHGVHGVHRVLRRCSSHWLVTLSEP
jgi:hypothetical protein